MQKPQHRTSSDNVSFVISSEIMPNRLSRDNMIECGTKIGDMTKFISKNDLSFFQGCVVKYVCRYLNKNGIQDLEKIIHYCELEIKKLKDGKKTKSS